jgi:hypothetical protein
MINVLATECKTVIRLTCWQSAIPGQKSRQPSDRVRRKQEAEEASFQYLIP